MKYIHPLVTVMLVVIVLILISRVRSLQEDNIEHYQANILLGNCLLQLKQFDH